MPGGRVVSFFGGEDGTPPVIVIDTLSMALGGEDEKGPRAVGFINDCLDLLKERQDLGPPSDPDDPWNASWYGKNPEIANIDCPVASQVVIIHNQTKTGVDFGGHRAIAANTQGLYRVRRFGKLSDTQRPFAGQLTPMRVKGIMRPPPISFDVDVVSVDGTKQTAAVLKDKAAQTIPKNLWPVIEALRELEISEEITPAKLNDCLDVVAASGAKSDPAKRKARQRLRVELDSAGIIELFKSEDSDKVDYYRFYDPGEM